MNRTSKKKRLLSMLLIACMLFTSLPLPVVAEEAIDEPETVENTESALDQEMEVEAPEENLSDGETTIDESEPDEENIEDIPLNQSNQEDDESEESEGDEESQGDQEDQEDVEPMVLRAPKGGTIEIGSFDDLKPYLEYKDVKNFYDYERCALKKGDYEITQSFEIDLNDEFFAGKEDAIQYGLISADQNFTINGNGNTISFKQNDAVALFGTINAPAFTIENLTINYPGDVAGFGFAHRLQSADIDNGFAKANGIVKNITANVGGDITPLPALGMEISSNNFAGNFKGMLSSGFSFYIGSTNLDNIEINIDGNIGSENRLQISPIW